MDPDTSPASPSVTHYTQKQGYYTHRPLTHSSDFTTFNMSLPSLTQLMASLPVAMDPSPAEQCCPICYTEYSPAHCPVILHGSHIFGKECLHQWLSESSTCPLCRVEVIRSPQQASVPAAVGYPTDEDFLYNLTGGSAQFYLNALASGVESRPLLEAYAASFLYDVRRRTGLYTSRQLDMDARYSYIHHPTRELAYQPSHSVSRPLDVDTLVLTTWMRYVSNLSKTPSVRNGAFSVWQHPLTGALILETFAALARWRGDVKSSEILSFCLGRWLDAWERDVYPEQEYRRPDGWAWLRRVVTESVVEMHSVEIAEELKVCVGKLRAPHGQLFERQSL